MPSLDPAVVRRLRDISGTSGVLTDPDLMAGHLTDWTGQVTGAASAVVRPRDAAQVAEVVACCAREGIAIVPQGGNTGLVYGSVPPQAYERPLIVLSLTRLAGVGPVDVAGRCVSAGGGATLAAVQRAAAAAGLEFGVDLAARDSATVGGMIATNAGGIRVVRRGGMRAQLLGIEAVLADGSVIRRDRPLRKDNTGYDLPGLFAGSEGTLAVVTGALLRLVVPPAAVTVCLAAVDSVAAAQHLVHRFEAAGLILEAAELMTGAGMDLVCADPRVRRPMRGGAPFFALLELSGGGAFGGEVPGGEVQGGEALSGEALGGGSAGPAEAVAQVLAGAEGLLDAVVDAGPARAIWETRERHTGAIARASSSRVVKLDVSVPLARLGDLVALVDGLAARFGGRPILFGHMGDGNLHVNVLDVPELEAAGLTDAVLRGVDGLGGSISAEHGVGRAKTGWLHLGRDAADVAAMRAIKSALDPAGLLNPGVIFG